MDILKSILVNTVSSVLLFSLVIGGIWFYFGTTTVTATVNGSPYDGAVVMVDGSVAGKTPYSDKLGPGWHDIKVLPGKGASIIETERSFTFLTALRGTGVVAEFTSRSMLAETRIACVINGRKSKDCDVEVDGKYMGTTPLIVELPPGEHDIYVLPPETIYTQEGLWELMHQSTSAPASLVAQFTLSD